MSIQVLVDEIRKSERAPLVPRIDYRRVTGASQDDREVTAREMQRLTDDYLASMRVLYDNLQSNLNDRKMSSAEAFFADTADAVMDMVSNARGV